MQPRAHILKKRACYARTDGEIKCKSLLKVVSFMRGRAKAEDSWFCLVVKFLVSVSKYLLPF